LQFGFLSAQTGEDVSRKPLFFPTRGVLIGEKFFKTFSVILLVASIVSWGLVYAFIEKEECSKEEKAFG
jgi:hypothetical protein